MPILYYFIIVSLGFRSSTSAFRLAQKGYQDFDGDLGCSEQDDVWVFKDSVYGYDYMNIVNGSVMPVKLCVNSGMLIYVQAEYNLIDFLEKNCLTACD